MTKILYFIVLLIPITSYSQLEITPSLGYMFVGKIQFEEGVIDIGNSSSFGCALNAHLTDNIAVEMNYTWMSPTEFKFLPANPQELQGGETTTNTHFILLNAISYLIPNGNIKPFISLGAGTTIFDIRDVKTVYRFTANVGLGVRWKITNLMTLKVQSRGIVPFHLIGNGFYAGFGTNGINVGYTLNAAVPLPIADISVGLSIAL